MIRFIAVMVPLVFIINGVTKGDWLEALFFAMAVAVGLAPELLPMLVTVNLSKGALAMSRKKVIVKRLNSIQNFGAMDVLCTDKTGTLTQDRIILEKYVDLAGKESDKVLDYAYLNSYYQSGLKNLLDVAVLKYTRGAREAAFGRQLSQGGRDSIRLHAPAHVGHRARRQSERLLICKGAVEEVFSVCATGEVDATSFALDASHLAELQAQTKSLNEDGFRVISIAYKRIAAGQTRFSVNDESGLTLLGYIAFLDPPKDSVRAALRKLARHGISVKILTGDNEIVTLKICREVGLQVNRVVLGHEMEGLEPDRAQRACRVRPGLREALAGAESRGDRGAAQARACGRIHGRRHQRRPRAQGGRCRHLGRHRGGHREGVGGHRAAGEEPPGSR